MLRDKLQRGPTKISSKKNCIAYHLLQVSAFILQAGILRKRTKLETLVGDLPRNISKVYIEIIDSTRLNNFSFYTTYN